MDAEGSTTESDDAAAVFVVPLKSKLKPKLNPLAEVDGSSTESGIEVTSVHVKPRPKAPSTLPNTLTATPKSVPNPKLKSVAISLSAAVGSKEAKAKGGEQNKKGKREDDTGYKVDVKQKGVKMKAEKELQPPKRTIQGQVKDALEKKATHLDDMDVDVTIPECLKKLKPKVPLQLVGQTNEPEMMVEYVLLRRWWYWCMLYLYVYGIQPEA